MAEYLGRAYAQQLGAAVELRSGSTLGLDGRPAHPHAVAVLKDKGIDLRPHRAQPIDQELMDWADFVVVMELFHAAELRQRFPDQGDKILMLGTFGGKTEISDPVNSSRRRFRGSRDEIDRCVRALLNQLG